VLACAICLASNSIKFISCSAMSLCARCKVEKDCQAPQRGRSWQRLHLVSVPCMDMCPKRVVTICILASQPMALSIQKEGLYRREAASTIS